MPLFMTELDETDGDGGENLALEALKAMAYEGTRAEIAENFRQQGNDCARAKQWTDAKEFYDKAIAALKGPQNNPDPDAAGPDVIEVELDEKEEEKKEKVIEEACYVNRALCNLEKSECISLVLCFVRASRGRKEQMGQEQQHQPRAPWTQRLPATMSARTLLHFLVDRICILLRYARKIMKLTRSRKLPLLHT